jgi:hypothetical protein
MPLTPFLKGIAFNPEATRAMGVAFEKVCAALRLVDRADPIVELVAKKIIELAQQGELNPDLLCEGVLKEFRERPL